MTATPISDPRNVLTPEALTMMDAIARTGSFAGAARELGKVPSALTYNVRQLEDALDVLLFDRSSRQATLTAAGQELLDEGRRLLDQMDAVANRVKRVATGWETQLSIAIDDVISRSTVFDLCAAFYAETGAAPRPPRQQQARGDASAASAPTRLRLRSEVLAGTWEALVSGHADLAIGVMTSRELPSGMAMQELGLLEFVFVVAPQHPLATAPEPIGDADIVHHRALAVADSAHRFAPLTLNLLPGQDVLTVSDMQCKIEALARGVGCGFVPEPMARAAIAEGRLVVRDVQRVRERTALGYAWRTPAGRAGNGALGLALAWWLERLESPTTRRALLERHHGPARAGAAR
jgi:DNA-binding transcriptional LysR family regulator